VRVETQAEAEVLVLKVHNTGAPIPPELLPHIFEPMERGAALVGQAGRSIGLGLFIVSSIARAHGGTVSVESTAEKGTLFTVRLPRRPAVPPSPAGDRA
jgi:signal transduction histidine kinase